MWCVCICTDRSVYLYICSLETVLLPLRLFSVFEKKNEEAMSQIFHGNILTLFIKLYI